MQVWIVIAEQNGPDYGPRDCPEIEKQPFSKVSFNNVGPFSSFLSRSSSASKSHSPKSSIELITSGVGVARWPLLVYCMVIFLIHNICTPCRGIDRRQCTRFSCLLGFQNLLLPIQPPRRHSSLLGKFLILQALLPVFDRLFRIILGLLYVCL